MMFARKISARSAIYRLASCTPHFRHVGLSRAPRSTHAYTHISAIHSGIVAMRPRSVEADRVITPAIANTRWRTGLRSSLAAGPYALLRYFHRERWGSNALARAGPFLYMVSPEIHSTSLQGVTGGHSCSRPRPPTLRGHRGADLRLTLPGWRVG